MRIHALIVLFSTLSLATPVLAQSAPSSAKPKALKLEAGEIELRKLLTTVGDYLNRSYLFDPAFVNGPRGRVLEDPSFFLPRELTLTQSTVEDVLSQILYSKGYLVLTIDREKRIYEVVNDKVSGSRAIRSTRTVSPQAALSLRHRFEFIRCVIPVQHVDPRHLVSQIRGTSGLQRTVMTAVSAHQIMISDLAPMVASAIEILRAIDVPSPKPPVKVQSRETVALSQDVEQMQLRLQAMDRDLLLLRKEVKQLRESESRIRAAYEQVDRPQSAKK